MVVQVILLALLAVLGFWLHRVDNKVRRIIKERDEHYSRMYLALGGDEETVPEVPCGQSIR
jgi:hypothetical protein